MANQTVITTLLDKLKHQIKVYQQARKLALREKELLHSQPGTSDPEAYVGLSLEIGNELLITAEMVKLYPALTNALGRVVIIDEISSGEKKTVKASIFGIHMDVDVRAAQQMRQAYLHREQASS